MATREELANQASEEDLRQLASRHNVQVSDQASREELVQAIVYDSSIKKSELTSLSKGENPSSGEGTQDTGNEQDTTTTDDDTDTDTESDEDDEMAGFDPMLVDPEAAARERAEGRTSDAALRTEGNVAAETPADVTDGVKSTDAGPEDYPFPTAGDVDVATVPEAEGAEEFMAPLEVEDWVVLGDHPSVPPRLVGRRAAIIDAPREHVPVDEVEEQWITVKTRDDVNATITVPMAAVAEVQKGGSSPLVRG